MIASLGRTSTSAIDEAVFERNRKLGGFASKGMSPPWFGRRDALEALSDAGLIEIDPGVAPYHAPGEPTPVVRELFVEITPAGKAFVEEADAT